MWQPSENQEDWLQEYGEGVCLCRYSQIKDFVNLSIPLTVYKFKWKALMIVKAIFIFEYRRPEGLTDKLSVNDALLQYSGVNNIIRNFKKIISKAPEFY